MDAIDSLVQEHRLIEKALEAMQSFAEALGAGQADPQDLPRFVTFLGGIADVCPHGKEEDILLEELIGTGLARDDERLSPLLSQHARGRELLDTLREHGAPTTPESIAEPVRELAALLHDHFQKEDEQLFALARERLSEQARAELWQRFQAYEEEHTGAEFRPRLLERGAALVARYQKGE